MGVLFSILWRELVLRWNLERSHAVIATAYGFYLQHAQTFGGPGIAFRAMDKLAQTVLPGVDSETSWGSLISFAGLMTFAGIINRDQVTRKSAAIFLAMLWLVMGVCFFVSNPRSPACIVYAVLAWAAFTRFWQAAQPQLSGDLPA